MSITFVYYCYGNEAYTDLEVLSSGIVPTCKVKSIYLLNEVGQKNKKKFKTINFWKPQYHWQNFNKKI